MKCNRTLVELLRQIDEKRMKIRENLPDQCYLRSIAIEAGSNYDTTLS